MFGGGGGGGDEDMMPNTGESARLSAVRARLRKKLAEKKAARK
jgi:hypothetical protein